MQDSLKTLLTSICEVSDQVNTVTTDLSDVTTSISHGATEQADKASLISTASEELTLTIGEVAQQSVVTAESVELVEKGVEQSAGAALDQIVSSATQVQGMIASIATATEEQTAVTQEIANDINTINDISARSLELVERSAHDVSGLTQRVDELKDLISKFKIA